MKKTIKGIALTITILLALIGATGTVAAASGYITWGGTDDFEQTIINLDLISERGQELKKSNKTLKESNKTLAESNETLKESNETLKANSENINRELEQTKNKVLDKENEIDSLNQRIEALEKRVEGGQTTQDQLKQAEEDMRDVKNKSEQVLGEFN